MNNQIKSKVRSGHIQPWVLASILWFLFSLALIFVFIVLRISYPIDVSTVAIKSSSSEIEKNDEEIQASTEQTTIKEPDLFSTEIELNLEQAEESTEIVPVLDSHLYLFTAGYDSKVSILPDYQRVALVEFGGEVTLSLQLEAKMNLEKIYEGNTEEIYERVEFTDGIVLISDLKKNYSETSDLKLYADFRKEINEGKDSIRKRELVGSPKDAYLLSPVALTTGELTKAMREFNQKQSKESQVVEEP